MIPYTVEIIGKEEPIDAVKLAYAENKQTGSHYLHAVTIDGRIATIDMDKTQVIIWENNPSKEDLATVDRLIKESKEDIMCPTKKTDGMECQ